MRAAARLIKNDLKLPMSRIIVYSDMRHYPEAVGELTRMGVQPMGGPVERLVTERWRNFGLRLAARGQIEGAKAFGKFSEAVYDNIYSPAYHAEMDRRAMGLMSINLINRLTIIQPGNIPIGDRILEAAMRWQRRNRG